ncbi:hypothetical protein ACFS07_05655 [Undibacterium arcticum]
MQAQFNRLGKAVDGFANRIKGGAVVIEQIGNEIIDPFPDRQIVARIGKKVLKQFRHG